MKIFHKIAVYFVLLLLYSCGSEQQKYEAFQVATSADNPPYSFIEEDQIVGFEIDLINRIAQEINARIVIKNVPFGGIIQSLVNGDVDLLIAGVSKTPERDKMVDFSIPYFYSTTALITKSDLKITNLQDLKDKIIGAQIGSTWQTEAQNIADKTPGVKLKILANNFLLVEELRAGNIDAVVMEMPQVKEFISRHRELGQFELSYSKSALSIAFKKGSSLKNKVDDAILKLQEEGYIKFLVEKWF
jgi:ABC-type amino acid transport substrate-binding protein